MDLLIIHTLAKNVVVIDIILGVLWILEMYWVQSLNPAVYELGFAVFVQRLKVANLEDALHSLGQSHGIKSKRISTSETILTAEPMWTKLTFDQSAFLKGTFRIFDGYGVLKIKTGIFLYVLWIFTFISTSLLSLAIIFCLDHKTRIESIKYFLPVSVLCLVVGLAQFFFEKYWSIFLAKKSQLIFNLEKRSRD